MIGIYMIKNLKNNKVYIGMSTDIDSRILFHKRRLMQNTHKNIHLQKSFDKYGIESFSFNVIEECDKDLLPDREKYWISHFKSHDEQHGYNKTYGGYFGRLSDTIVNQTADKLRLRTHSDEMKKRISDSLKGRKSDPEIVNRRANSRKTFNTDIEVFIVILYKVDGLTKKQISNLFGVKLSQIDSIIKRYGVTKSKNKGEYI